MNKLLIATAIIASFASNVNAAEKLDSSTFRTGTCGGTKDAQGTCVSMGIDMDTGKVYKSTSSNDSNIWNGKNVEEIGQFATVDNISKEIEDRLQVVENKESVIINRYETAGDVTGNVSITGDNTTVNMGNIGGAVHNSCGASVASGATVSCTTNYDVDASDLTVEQLAALKGDDGADGAKGDKGNKGDTGTAGKDGKDGTTTVVNAYDKDQVDADFVSETELKDTVKELKNDIMDVEGKANNANAVNNSQQHYIEDLQDHVGTKETLTDVELNGDKLTLTTTSETVIESQEQTSTEFEVDLSKYNDTAAIEAAEAASKARDQDLSDDIGTVAKTTYGNGDLDGDGNVTLQEAATHTRRLVELGKGDGILGLVDDNTSAIKDADEASKARDAALSATIVNNEAESVARDEAIAESVVVETEARIEGDKRTLKSANTFTSEAVSEQAKVQAIRDAGQDNRMTQAEADIYNNTAVNNRQSSQIRSLGNRVGKLEVEVAGIHNDNRRQDGMIAAGMAANAMEMPLGWNGDWAVQVGVGAYNGQEALAIGAVTATEYYAAKVIVSGTNADDWNELAVGAGITIATSIFE